MGIPAIKKNVRASLSSGLMQKLPLAACLEGHRDHPAFEGREGKGEQHRTVRCQVQHKVQCMRTADPCRRLPTVMLHHHQVLTKQPSYLSSKNADILSTPKPKFTSTHCCRTRVDDRIEKHSLQGLTRWHPIWQKMGKSKQFGCFVLHNHVFYSINKKKRHAFSDMWRHLKNVSLPFSYFTPPTSPAADFSH